MNIVVNVTNPVEIPAVFAALELAPTALNLNPNALLFNSHQTSTATNSAIKIPK